MKLSTAYIIHFLPTNDDFVASTFQGSYDYSHPMKAELLFDLKVIIHYSI